MNEEYDFFLSIGIFAIIVWIILRPEIAKRECARHFWKFDNKQQKLICQTCKKETDQVKKSFFSLDC